MLATTHFLRNFHFFRLICYLFENSNPFFFLNGNSCFKFRLFEFQCFPFSKEFDRIFVGFQLIKKKISTTWIEQKLISSYLCATSLLKATQKHIHICLARATINTNTAWYNFWSYQVIRINDTNHFKHSNTITGLENSIEIEFIWTNIHTITWSKCVKFYCLSCLYWALKITFHR